MTSKIIYDFGANCGQDLPYYLLKADLVVAVEANKHLCDQINAAYAAAISSGRLIVLNVALYVPDDGEVMPSSVILHVPKSDCKAGLGDAHATLVSPEKIDDPFFADPEEYEAVEVNASSPAEIISKYGQPYYIKIDVEHYDHKVLRHLFANGIFPEYISAECHNAEVLGLMLSAEMYDNHKVVTGPSVGQEYKNARISLDLDIDSLSHELPEISEAGFLKRAFLIGEYEFKTGCSGPFGEDIKGEWIGANELFCELACTGLGWIDVHARRKGLSLNLID